MPNAINKPPFTSQVPYAYNSFGKRINTADAYDSFLTLRTAEYTPIVESKPLPYVDYVRNRLVPNTPANVYGLNGEIVIDGSAALQSLYTRKHGIYLPGVVGLCGIGVRMATPDVGIYEFGYGDDVNRMGMQVNNGDWTIFIQSGGVRYSVKPRSEWSDPLDGTGPSRLDFDKIDKSKVVLRIYLGWYGYTSIDFQLIIAGQTVPVLSVYNDIDGVSVEQPNLPVFAEANGGILYVGGRQYGVYGRYLPQERVTTTPRVDKVIGTTFEPILSIRVKQLYKLNGVAVALSSMAGAIDDGLEYAVYLHEASALTGAVWGDIPDTMPETTVLEYDESATALAPGGYKVTANIIAVAGTGGSVATIRPDIPDIDVPFDLALTLVARSLATTTNAQMILALREEW